MPVSDTEKHGVSTSGHRISDKVENVPIKKRRFLVRSPSPPPTVNSVDHTDNHCVSEKGVPSNVISDAKIFDKPDDRLGEDEEFCGISILAAAACSSSLGRDCGYAEESSVLEQVNEGSVTTEPLTSSKGLSKEDVLNSSEMSSGATSCVSTEPVAELASISTAVNSPQKDANVGKILKAESSRDERLHWDLNVVMDAWEQPFDDLDAQNDVSHNISEDPSKFDHNRKNHNDNNEKNHDIKACLNPEQFPVLKDKSLTSHSNPNFVVIKSTVENTTYKSHDEESVNPNDGLAADETHVSASHTMIEPEGISLKSLKSNDGRSDLQKLDDEGVSDATFDVVSANTHISLCVSSSSDTLIKLKPNMEAPKILHHEGNDLVENVDMKTLDPHDQYEFALSDSYHLSDRDALDSMPKRSCEVQENYDSQYEDGELREPSERAWEEYDREAENVDYVSEYKGTFSAEPSDYHVSDSIQEVGTTSLISSDDHNVNYDVIASETVDNDKGREEGDDIKLSHTVEKTDLSLGKEVLEGSKSFPSSGDTESRMEPRAFKRSLQSQVEGPVSRGDTSRDEQIKKMDNRFESGSVRSFERIQYSFNNQVRGRQGASWDESSNGRRGFRCHYSPVMRGKRLLDDDGVVDRDDLRYVDSQDDVPYHSKTRVGAEVEPCTGFDSRFKSDRKFSPDRRGGFGRGRSFMYGPFGESRGGRGRYNGPSPDETFQSSLKYRRPLSRRESSPPFRGRGQSNIHHSHRKSPSQSRSRSPIIWNSARRRLGAGSAGGTTFLRQRSRSPNFRSETRMQRPRSPNQQPGFGVDHGGGFRPISRNHGSPHRWNSTRKDEMGQFRELGYKQRTQALDRSPSRIPLRGDRGSALDGPRNLKSEGYLRMTDRISDDSSRGVRYDENYDDRRKQFNHFRPTRRHYDDDISDSLSMPNSFRDRDASSFQDRGLRGFDNRLGDVHRRFRGENQNPSFVYERDGKFNNNSKQFRIDGMDSSHNLKSDEQYQPKYAGRVPDVSGTYRGSRYENFENRRKHYSATHVMRRTDNDDTEKRLNENENENFEDTCARGT